MSVKTLLRQWADPILRHLTFSLPVQTVGGKMWIPIVEGTGLGVYDQIIRGEEAWKLKIFKSLPEAPGSLFVDVGANLGQTLLQLRMVDAERPYLGFEPNPDCLHYVFELIRRNGFRNVDLVATGLGESTDVLTLYLPPKRSTDSTATLLKELRPDRQYDARHVLIFNEEHLSGLVAGRAIGFVKVDVEGAELEVFKGIKYLLNQERPPVMCEVLFTDPKGDLEASRVRNAELVSLLQAIGYQVLQIRKSDDYSQITDLVAVDSFPSDFHSPANSALCDYLFLPAEKVENLRGRLS
jgi:FkbM family methyltransferase